MYDIESIILAFPDSLRIIRIEDLVVVVFL